MVDDHAVPVRAQGDVQFGDEAADGAGDALLAAQGQHDVGTGIEEVGDEVGGQVGA